MPGTKWFCILLGVLLIISFLLFPIPLVLQATSSHGVQRQIRELIEEGALVVNQEVLAEKHPQEVGEPDVGLIVAWSVIRATSGLGGAVSWSTLLMGVTWLAVGIRIPSRFASAPTPPAPPTQA